jgi:hypothetical protein
LQITFNNKLLPYMCALQYFLWRSNQDFRILPKCYKRKITVYTHTMPMFCLDKLKNVFINWQHTFWTTFWQHLHSTATHYENKNHHYIVC